MKRKLFLMLLLAPFLIFAQQAEQDREVTLLEDQNLIQVVYYYDNGNIQQKGTYNLEGELHGEWESYTLEGGKRSIGTYVNGKKHGKWFFWANDVLKEVDYSNNKIASVQQWKEGTKLALQR